MKSTDRELKIFSLSKLLIGLMTIALTIIITSCGDDDSGSNPVSNTIVDVAAATDDLSTLVSAIERLPDVASVLANESGTYTVFAPTNDAFAALLEAIGQTSLDDVPDAVLERILQYHVISGSGILASDLTDGTNANTLLGEEVAVTVVAGASAGDLSVSINSSDVTTADVSASNGVVHIIDAVLVPELEASILNTIVEPAYFNNNYSILTAAVVKAELLTTLLGDGPFTLFAPNNDAFTAAGITSLDDLTGEVLTPILQYHVLSGEVKAEDLPATGSAVTTLNGDFYLSINDNVVYINGATRVTATNLDYDNGVVHTISQTLQPASQDVVAIAVAASTATTGAEFGQLVAALTAVENDPEAEDLITALQGDGPFTVFAPTDDAFQKLYDKVPDDDADGDNDIDDLVAAVDGNLTTIATVLQYHVYSGRVFSTDIPTILNGATSAAIIPLAAGTTWTLNDDNTIVDTDEVLAIGTDDASIIATNSLGTNGVIHTIDEVILP